MADEGKAKTVDTEVKSRLDVLFPDELPVGSADSGMNSLKGLDPLEELRNLVMSIEWEITDEVMARFVDQIEALKAKYGKDRILVMFLQLLGSLGLYVRSYKAKAHPSSFRLIHSVYSGFDKVMSSDHLDASEKKKLLYVELNKYKELKEQIDQAKTHSMKDRKEVMPNDVRAAKEGPVGEETVPGVAAFEPKAVTETPSPGKTSEYGSADIQKVVDAIEDMKISFKKELEEIRKEIQKLRKIESSS
ncbi:MAG: hypothetical protein ACOWWM_11625 [Desulfobacterales bacterium]